LGSTSVDYRNSEVDENICHFLGQSKSILDISLNNKFLSSNDVRELAKLRKLVGLNLSGTSIGDECFDVFEAMPELLKLGLRWTNVTFNAAESFAVNHPNCLIWVGDPKNSDPSINPFMFNDSTHDYELYNKLIYDV
jgi:hypothetical protein